jgi:diguanylate cyclase (GGDEF)-like protein/PAS domain S-box-containing protein
MFELSPTAFCISTLSALDSRYVKVNQAYLDLVGKTWDELRSEPLAVNTGAVSPDRLRRIQLLDTVGYYKLEEVEIRHSSGRLIPTLISCQRRVIDGHVADMEIIIDISERKEFENRIVKAAYTDTMTDIPNRAAFDRELKARIAGLAEGNASGLAFIDLNGFKAVNDRHGHAVGDSLLKVIAMRLRARTKITDFVARLGGDEFGVLFGFPAPTEPDAVSRFRSLASSLCTPYVSES